MKLNVKSDVFIDVIVQGLIHQCTDSQKVSQT